MSQQVQMVLKWSVALAVALFLLAQLVPLDRANPPVQSALESPTEIQEILISACYDCHSFETQWPWYSRIAPVSWMVASHVKEGRNDLNFSRWPSYNFQEQNLILREMEKQIVEGKMPPSGYSAIHPDARLSPEQRDVLLSWIREGFIDEFELDW